MGQQLFESFPFSSHLYVIAKQEIFLTTPNNTVPGPSLPIAHSNNYYTHLKTVFEVGRQKNMNGIVWAKTKDFTSSLRINMEPLLFSVPAIPSTPKTPERRERRGWVRVLSHDTWESLKNDQMSLCIQWCDSITCYLLGVAFLPIAAISFQWILTWFHVSHVSTRWLYFLSQASGTLLCSSKETWKIQMNLSKTFNFVGAKVSWHPVKDYPVFV